MEMSDLPTDVRRMIHAVRNRPDRAVHLARLSAVLRETSNKEAALALAEEAKRLAPEDAVVHRLTYWSWGRNIPPWHFPMMNDTHRNAAYRRAIEALVTPESIVLDVGAGAGLLSLFAARAGAKHVYAIERVGPLAETAAEIVEKNGYADRISVIAKKSSDVVMGIDMSGPADVVVSDVIGPWTGRKEFEELLEARRALATDDAAMIPRCITMRGRLVGGEALARLCRVGDIDGFDFRLFSRFQPAFQSLTAPMSDLIVLSADFDALTLELGNDSKEDEETPKAMELKATQKGTVHGVMVWMCSHLDTASEIEMDPRRFPFSHWGSVFHPFSQPIMVERGETIRIYRERSGPDVHFMPDV